MFDRSLFKQNAKIPLKSTYWTAFLVCLMVSIVFGFTSGNSINSSSSSSRDFIFRSDSFASLAVPLTMLATVLVGATLLGMAITFFLHNPLIVGQARFFVQNRRAPAEFTTVFSSFQLNYKNTVMTMAAQTLLITLWTLLLIIPGIIASYSYTCVPYLLAENPSMPAGRALKLSKEMTEGYKFDLFVLDLSFFGWWFLGLLPCGLGLFFVDPYYQATHAEAYEFLKQGALSRGICDISEFIPLP